jgi:hypothetical protein
MSLTFFFFFERKGEEMYTKTKSYQKICYNFPIKKVLYLLKIKETNGLEFSQYKRDPI